MTKKRKLSKSEYPAKIGCLLNNCLTSCNMARRYGGYKECPNFEWKSENADRYEIALNSRGNISAVYEYEKE